jgi:hypothetical protein
MNHLTMKPNQKHGSRKVEGKEYFKWTLVVPPEERGAWMEGSRKVGAEK